MENGSKRCACQLPLGVAEKLIPVDQEEYLTLDLGQALTESEIARCADFQLAVGPPLFIPEPTSGASR